jgi:DNA polymerase III alpha subunit
MWLNIKTEFTFGAVYGPVKKIVPVMKGFAGIADHHGTWGFVKWHKACKSAGIKPIFGVVLPVVSREDAKERRCIQNNTTIIALNYDGLKKIYRLVDLAHQQFYYFPRIYPGQIKKGNVAVVAENLHYLEPWHCVWLTPATPIALRSQDKYKFVAGVDNWYIKADDVGIYEPLAHERKIERKTTPMRLLTHDEWLAEFPSHQDALGLMKQLAEECQVEFKKAKMVRYPEKVDFDALCRKKAKERNIDLTDPVYKARYEREMSLIEQKGYIDYFLVVADLIEYAKKIMIVGPGRGSSAGSLVCYILGITEVDPIPFGLYFERFIDINRFDLPDIDTDFQQDKRHLVIRYLQKKYGKDKVCQLGNITTMKPKSAIVKFAKAFALPHDEVEALKDAIIERSGGDSRAAFCLKDTFETTDVGKNFIEKYPVMKKVAEVEQHAQHTSVHAAAVIVCNEPITDYAGINSRDKQRIAQLDKKDAEELGLLKIDALGLRTLSILADVCDQLNKPYKWLFGLPLDDKMSYDVFNEFRLTGIFQFEGNAIRSLVRQTKMEKFEDLAAMSALGRPGPLATGGATKFIEAKNGTKDIDWLADSDLVKQLTKDTFGVVIYQEQMLSIGREYGRLSWEDVCDLRKAASKSLGDEYFGRYKGKFIEGAVKNGEKEEHALSVWDGICTAGSWSFNKCLGPKTKLILSNGKRITIYSADREIRKGKILRLLSIDKEGNLVTQVPIAIYRSGKKNCWRYHFTDDRHVDCTPDHKFIIDGKWRAIKNAKKDSLIKLTHGYVKYLGKKSIGKVMTYDIEMPYHHNFVIDGWIITHNSHAVSYALVSYWCAYMKAHHLLEFAVASLNHTKDLSSAIKLLRDLKEQEGVEYCSFDAKKSIDKWAVIDGVLYGPLTNIDGIGTVSAKKIMKLRAEGKPFPAGIEKKMSAEENPFTYLYPAKDKYGEYYKHPEKFGIRGEVSQISKITSNGNWVAIGRLVRKNLRDANEIVNVAKRGGKYVDGPTAFLNITIEDDTENIICTINRFDFQKFGKDITETGKLDKDWYLVYGEMKHDWRKLYVKNIRRITK